jgi:hypothetical protein
MCKQTTCATHVQLCLPKLSSVFMSTTSSIKGGKRMEPAASVSTEERHQHQ